MTKPGGAALPEAVLRLLDGEDLEAKEGETFLLLTAAEDGWPRLALLSAGEVYAPSATELRLALWPKSTTTRNLSANRRATLAVIHQGVAYYAELEAQRVADSEHGLARFRAEVRSVRVDEVGYAELTSGVRFRLKGKEEVLARWRRSIASLRAEASDGAPRVRQAAAALGVDLAPERIEALGERLESIERALE